ncbi:type I restriction enzyme HsdR N-terminal domain-containing protein [Halorubrum tebenquichense]|uniref:Restriction endonuclease, type I, EcoRI, R subunit/Type III n=1 Tax=Halorubrum tebenquichense DSM 14210 TaxID=1227485 RepID=M0D8B1_9EURY|nr:type I restriction enzyme HsdR N-terminal domain-containing protein [Halorubrum tebenquichense]ELZ31740.1 Restriction endonuclease, type I, EcoRI, R subunit/Type III [Halorubrum tebenquichense DSM 14210]
MDEEAVSDYVERSQSLVDSSPQMDEQNTRSRLIDPFIKDLLSWDFYSTEIEMEYSVRMGSSKKKVDYALFADGSPALFVEAKGCDTTITDTHADQLRSYMRQEWVDWGLLTNGKKFLVFRLQKDGDNPDVERLGEADLADLTVNDWMLAALSKNSIQSGASTEIYQRVERRRQAIATLSEQKDDIADSIRETVVDRVGEVVSQPAESLSKTLVDDLIAELEQNENESQIDARSDDQPADPTVASERPEVSGSYVVEVTTPAGSTHVSGDSQSDVMEETVDHLIENHGLIAAYEPLPYVPGQKIALLNDEPNHPTGDEMRTYRKVGGDYYVYTSFNKKDKKRHLSNFADACGVDISFDGKW